MLPDGMWLEFAFDQAYLKVLRAGQRQTGQVTPEVAPEVTPEVGRMLLALDGEMSRAELMAVLNLKDEKHFRTHYKARVPEPGCGKWTAYSSDCLVLRNCTSAESSESAACC